MSTTRREFGPGSARGSRAGFGGPPKQAFILHRYVTRFGFQTKVRDREDALASTRDACAPRILRSQPRRRPDP